MKTNKTKKAERVEEIDAEVETSTSYNVGDLKRSLAELNDDIDVQFGTTSDGLGFMKPIIPSEVKNTNLPNNVKVNDNSVYRSVYDENQYIENYGDLSVDPIDFENDDTAATDITQRGLFQYWPDNYECLLPEPMCGGTHIERRNNTHFVENLMDYEVEIAKKKADIIKNAIARKAEIDWNTAAQLAALDIDAKQKIYESQCEYNTQTGMHRQSNVVMFHIIDKKNDK